MKLTDEQIERASTVNLPQFLMANGFDLKRVGREYVWKEHDSLHIKDNAPGERGVWHRFSTNEGGDNIAFLREYMGMSFVEAVEALNGEHYDRTYTPQQHTHTERQQKAQAHEPQLSENDNAKRVFAYLCKTRGLDYDLVKELVQSGAVAQEQKTGNALFKYTDEHGKIVGAEKVGTSTEHKFKGIATGSASGYGFEVCRGNGNDLLFFESSIDMLSYLQMHKAELTDHRLVSMMGVKPQTVIDTMARYGISPENVYLCSDNDKAGNEFAERLMSEYPGMKRITTPDTYKDWNDMLKGIPKQIEEQKTEKKEVDRMAVIGNEYWNSATDNREKAVIGMSADDFRTVYQKLEDSGLNYRAYRVASGFKMAVNADDVQTVRQLAGRDLEAARSNVPFSPPEKNIIGNAEYRYIPQKEYVSADRDLILKMADTMDRQGIKFSGRIYPTGKGTLTVSRADLSRVQAIRDDIIGKRRQVGIAEKGQIIGNRSAASQNRHLYMSTLTPQQYEEVKPFIETNARYSGVIRDGKVMFSVDKDEAQAFHRALDTAKREVGLIHAMQDKGLSMEQMVALSPIMHRLAVEDAQLQLSDFFDRKYDDAQFGEMLSLVNAYLDQPVAERFGEYSKLNDMLEAKSSFDRAAELSDFFSQHEFSDEQRAAITAMFVGDVTRGQIDSIDETFTVEDIQEYDEILHNALQDSDVADFLTAHKQAVTLRENAAKEPTEEEQLFMQADVALFLAKQSLSSDEWEDMAYPLFENGYTDTYKPNENAILGYHLSEPEFYALAEKFHRGDDIRRELALGLMEHSGSEDIEFGFSGSKMSTETYLFSRDRVHNLHAEFGEDSVKLSFDNAEREVTYEEIGQAFLDYTFEEFNDLMYWRVLDYIRDDIPEIEDETVKQLIAAFDGAAMADWGKGDNLPKLNRIKKALFDILGDTEQTEKAFACIAKNKYNVSFESEKPESSIHFGLLGNGITAYDVSRTDPETHDYPTVAHISPEGVVRIYDDSLSEDDMELIREEAKSAREKFISDWKMLSPIQQFQKLLDNADISTSVNISREKLSMEQKIEKYMPFVFFGEGERPEPEAEDQVKGTYMIYQLPSGDKYHGVRFEGMEQLKKDNVQLNHDDYELVYEGAVGEFRGNATLEALYTQFNTAHPADFTGHSLSVSDVIVIDIDGKQTAYYCDTAGFAEMPEFFREKEIVQEKSAVESIEFIGDSNDFDAVKSAAQNDSFGTTIADGDRFSVVIKDDADISDVRRLIETAQENGVYLNVPSANMLEARFGADFMQTEHKPTVADLSVGDVILYEGKRREVEQISDERIMLKDLDAPDFGGVLLGTSDVLAYDGWREDMESKGFEILSKAEKSEPVAETPEIKKIHQVITNAGFDGGIDDKMEYATVDEAIKAGRDYLADDYLGFSVYNQETKQIEHTEGDFPLTQAYNAEILKLNGINEPEYKGYVTMAKVGDFYEMYGKNAEIGAEILGLRMLSKHGEPMVGFPDHIKDEYSKKLGEAGYSVLIEQAFEINPPKREERLTTLQDVVDKYFGTDCESAETFNGTWKLSIAEGDKVGELFHNGEAVCGIYNLGDKMAVEPYQELTSFPKLLADAMLAHNPDKPVEIMDFQRTFETPLDKAKALISEFCIDEYGSIADFSDLHNVNIAYTTLTDDELPIQVTADLIDCKISYEFDGEIFSVENFENIEEMIDDALYSLSFDDLVSVPDEVLERHIKKEENIDLMSDASEIKDVSSQTDEPKSITMEFKGDSESLDEISDYALSIGAIIIKDNAGGTLSVDTYDNHQEELQNLAYMNGISCEVKGKSAPEQTAETKNEQPETVIDDDAPLFSDADIIEQIQADEKADIPFWEKPNTEGEQLSLFGDPEPIQQKKEKTKSEFSPGPVVDGVQVYEALAAEIDRGTGFVNGKLRVQDFYEEQHPTLEQLADFLKKEYGTGGHSGDGRISLVDYNYQGMTFNFENGEKFRHSWYNVAVMTESRLKDDTYLSAEQKAERTALKAEKAEEHTAHDTIEIGDKFRNKITGDICEVISLTGALPYYTDDCTVQRESGGFAITENISYDKLLNSSLYEYIGKSETEKEQTIPDIAEVEPTPTDKSTLNPLGSKSETETGLPVVKNLNQLKKAIKPGMMFEITDHHRPECIGERRIITGVSTVDFTSRKLDENGEPTGKDIHMDFDRAKNWSFDGGELTSRLDNGDMLMSFHFIDSLEREQTVKAEKKPIPLYTGEWAVADNRELFREIVSENERFAKMASEVIGNGKDPIDSVKALVGEFGMERTAFLTALNIVAHPSDGRFYPVDKAWACKVLSPYLEVSPDEVIHRTPEKEQLFERMIDGGKLYSIHNTHLAQFAETLIPEYEKYLEKSHSVEKTAPTLEVGDFIEYKGNEYKVESLDLDGFITLNDTSFGGAVKDRVTFIADEFINSGEYKVIEPKTEPTAETSDKSENFTITDDSLGEGGAKTKFRNNIAAITTLKQLEKENRPATAEEKEVLSKYVGWGGLAQAFDPNNASWEREYAELKEILTPQEYRQAQASTLDAFYTSPTVIDGIYEALGNFGFTGGNVLEPSMGVGNFFGCMPKEMQNNSQLYGVEIDSISGRIAQALYPDADIAIQGFEKNSYQNGCFDVAVGNVPFGELGFKDTAHNTTKLHDYFFLEAMDKLKNGGIIAFVTSAGTLDKRDEATRQMLADKADFIGAIRLPGGKNGAFKENAGTEVTADIIFLKKHEGKSVAEMSDIPDWVHIGETADGLPINKYFEQHPDMVLGTVVEGNKLYGNGTMVIAEDGFDLRSALHEAVSKLSAEISPDKARDVYAKTEQGLAVKIPSDLRNFSFFMQDDKVFFKKNAVSFEQRFDKKNAQFSRYKAFIELRDITRELIEAQELNKPDRVISELQAKLNTVYDDFYNKYGLIHSKTNKRYFSEDISYNLVAGLEKKIDKDKLVEKSDIFSKRTICPPKAVECVETAMEALTLSIAEKARVDFEYMSKLTGMTEDELKHDLVGEIFKIPHTENTYQTASEYLSGDIRAKLREAEELAEYDADFNINVNALQKAMPEPLKAGDIDVKIGAVWLDPKYYDQFMYELLGTPDNNRSDKPQSRWFKPSLIQAEYSEHSNSWHISNKKADKSVLVNQKYGTAKMNAYEIMEHLLNLREPKVYKTIEVPDGFGDVKEKRVIDEEATRVVQKKAKEIKKAFKAWIFKDTERRETIVERYNELFNSVRPREYDGSALTFPMMNSGIQLHDHQKNAIAHAMFGGNTLFAHSVGAGKTYEMIATAMESKRLGLCTKSLFAVPNHLTEQIGDDFQKLYPGANILVATKKDFQKANRQQLFAKIATGNYDAVIIGHSQLGMIPISKERQFMTIQSQIDDILRGIDELKRNEGSKFQIKAMEKTRKSLQKQLDRLEKANQDETITFEQLGIDKLFVDEAHEFKNLFTPTKLTNVAGISNSASQKALDLFLKCRYLDEKTGGRGVVFATGTPISNSVTELHTMMRYLEYDFLRDHGLQHFDNWVATFGEQKTDWELKPAGNGFKERTRVAQYTGMPELMSMFKQVADIRTADTLNLDVPDCDYKVVQVEATPFQQELVQELSDRADAINSGNVDPSIDNMLKITSDGRKLGLDPRLIDPAFEDNPDTKLNRCVENVARIHAETAEDKLTQIIFCDLGVPHKSSDEIKYDENGDVIIDDNTSAAERESLEEECDFCVYDDIKAKLVAKGIPAEEIAFIHDAKSEKQKSELFEKVRSGEVRILLGSTAKMGTGTNVQDKLIAVHDMDIPWRPADLDQRAGRIIRQGNQNKNVEIYRYVTKGTFDAYSYQTLENKQKFISQIMTSKEPARKCEDVDQQALTYSEIKALCTGDERIKEKLMLDNEVKELKTLASEYENTVYEMQDKIKAFPMREEQLTTALSNLQADRKTLKALPIDPETKLPVFKMKIGDVEYTDRKEAAKALEQAALAIRVADTPVKVGEFQGFPLSVTVHSPAMGGGMTATMKGQYTHTAKLISSFSHNLNRIEAGLYNIDRRIDQVKNNLSKLRVDFEEAKKIVSTPFPQQAELESKSERLEKLTTALNLAAIEAKKNAPKREQTCYFQRAQLKREAARVAKKKAAPKKTKAKDKKKPGLE